MTRLSMASTTTSASSNNKKLPYESLSHFNVLKKLQVAAPKYKVSLDAEVVALKNSDIGRGDNFYESTLSSLKRSRIAFQQEGDVEKRIQLDNNFYELMEMGFDRRLAGESIASGRFQPHVSGLKGAGGMVSRFFELNKSRKEQLDELKQTQLENKKGPFKYMPEFLHKYIDYVNSLKIIPKKSEQTRAFAFSAFFSFVVWANQGARSSFMYFVIGNLITMSMLLQRGMPQMKLIPGQRQQAGTWSSMAFTTAVALSLLFIIPSFLAAFFVTAIIPGMDVSARAKAAMIFGLFGNAYLSSFFEVFEDKSKNGYRWNKAVKGYLEPNLEAKLNKKVFGKQPNLDSYHLVPYDPDVDENPYQPKYLDELPGAAPLSGMGDLDESESKTHFDTWHVDLQNGRKPPVKEVDPEASWIGGKPGMFVGKPPSWLNSAYAKSLKKLTAWRGVQSKYQKDYSEFAVGSVGEFGFRDKSPSWLDGFNGDIWQEQLSISRKLARAFGTYRKTMWKLDPEVKLLACDGADKLKEGKKD